MSPKLALIVILMNSDIILIGHSWQLGPDNYDLIMHNYQVVIRCLFLLVVACLVIIVVCFQPLFCLIIYVLAYNLHLTMYQKLNALDRKLMNGHSVL